MSTTSSREREKDKTNNDDKSSSYCIDLEDVRAAARRIDGVAHRTPVLQSASVSAMSGRNLYFKVEAMQKTGSFKFRGALNAVRFVLEQQQQQREKTNNTTNNNNHQSVDELQVVTHSSGNHAQALALAAKLSSTESCPVTATIVMPENTSAVKKAAVLAFGGIPVMTANTNEARESEAERIRKETGATFVHPSEDPLVISGQGTVCLEFIEQMKEIQQQQQQQQQKQPLDTVIIPVGGGGLAAGNTIALRGMLGDAVKIILAEPATLDDAKRSFESKQLLTHRPDNKLDSVADGLKTTLGPNTWPIVRDCVDDIITVTEEEILRATKIIWQRLKVTIEPSAGVGVAVACLSNEFQVKYPDAKNVGIILCGGNVDVIKIACRMQEMGL